MNFTDEQKQAAEVAYWTWHARCLKNGITPDGLRIQWIEEYLLVQAIEATEPEVDLSEYQFGHSSMSSSQWAGDANLVASGVGE